MGAQSEVWRAFARCAHESWQKRNLLGKALNAPLPQEVLLSLKDSERQTRRTYKNVLDALLAARELAPRAPVLIEADPGFGKTTALRWVEACMAERCLRGNEEALLPVYVDLGDPELGSAAHSLESVLQHQFQRRYPIDYGSLPHSCPRLFLIDGLDLLALRRTGEVLVREAFEASVRTEDLYVLASRPLDHLRYAFEMQGPYVHVQLGPLDADARDQWLQTTLSDPAPRLLRNVAAQAGHRLLHVPLLWALVVRACLEQASDEVSSPWDTYPGMTGILDGFVQAAVRRAVREGRLQPMTHVYELTAAVEQVCYRAAQRGSHDAILLAELSELIHAPTGDAQDDTHAVELWERGKVTLMQAGLLWPDKTGQHLRFLHQSFAEYLAGRYCARSLRHLDHGGDFDAFLTEMLSSRALDPVTKHALACLATSEEGRKVFNRAFDFLSHACVEDACSLFSATGAHPARRLIRRFEDSVQPQQAFAAAQALAELDGDDLQSKIWGCALEDHKLDGLRWIGSVSLQTHDWHFLQHAFQAVRNQEPYSEVGSTQARVGTDMLARLRGKPPNDALLSLLATDECRHRVIWMIAHRATPLSRDVIASLETIAQDDTGRDSSAALCALAKVAPESVARVIRRATSDACAPGIFMMWAPLSTQEQVALREPLLDVMEDTATLAPVRVAIAAQLYQAYPERAAAVLRTALSQPPPSFFSMQALLWYRGDLAPLLAEVGLNDETPPETQFTISSVLRDVAPELGARVLDHLLQHPKLRPDARSDLRRYRLMFNARVQRAMEVMPLYNRGALLGTEVAIVLGNGREDEARPLLEARSMDCSSPQSAFFAAALLEELAEGAGVPALERLAAAHRTSEEHAWVALGAAQLLNAKHHEHGIQYLTHLAHHGPAGVRFGAAVALQDADAEMCGEVLTKLCAEPSVPAVVRERAARALATMNWEAGRLWLLSIARNADEPLQLRSACALSLADMGTEVAVDVLAGLCRVENPFCHQLVHGLGSLVNRGGVEWGTVETALRLARVEPQVVYKVARSAGRRWFPARQPHSVELSAQVGDEGRQPQTPSPDSLVAMAIREFQRAGKKVTLRAIADWLQGLGYKCSKSTLQKTNTWGIYRQHQEREHEDNRRWLRDKQQGRASPND